MKFSTRSMLYGVMVGHIRL